MKTAARFESNGFVELSLSAADVVSMLSMMKARMRRISHLDNAGPEDFAEVSRLARLCYVISGKDPVLPHLSKEDIEAMYVLPIQDSASGVLLALNEVRFSARTGGPVDPVMADRMVKSLVEVMLD